MSFPTYSWKPIEKLKQLELRECRKLEHELKKWSDETNVQQQIRARRKTENELLKDHM